MKTHYGKSKNKCWTLKVHQEFFYFLKAIFLITLASLSEFELKSQDNNITKKESVPSVYETLPMRFVVEELGNFYLDVIYPDNELLYVPVCDLFRTLKIQCIEGEEGDSIGGFIEREKNTYLIDYNLKRIKVGEKTINISKGLVKDMGIIYLESSLFSEAFGLTLIFNSRILSVQVKSSFELPIIKQQRIEKLQSNISKIKGEVIADTLLLRNYHLFKFGMVDWSITSIQAKMQSAGNRINLGIGTELLYGEANLSVNYSSQNNFDTRQFQYLWHWVDNGRKIIRQAQIGKIYNQTIAFINAPVIGTSIRNTPTTLRKATGYYVINELTEPDWNVELYINNVLVDFTKADASGLYVFRVPIVYGYTTLKLKFHGPMGEERTDERIINVPYTIMPTNEFEYGISGGFVADSVWSRYGKGEFNYGVNRFLTVGGGLEYLSSISNGPFIPYASATIQPLSKLTINVQYAYKVRSFLTLNYYFGKNSSLGLDYKKYYEGQLATIFSAPEERKIKISLPYKILKIRGYTRLDLTQLVYSDFTNNQGNLMVSGYLKQLSINSSTQFNWIDQKAPYITSDLALSYRLKRGYIIRPSTQYNAKENKFTMFRADIEKRIPKGFFSVSYQKNFSNNENYISMNLRFDLSFARANISSSYSNGSLTTAESVQGSLAFGCDNYIHASNNSSAGKGGIVLYPFLDLNQNGILDSGEHLVKVNNVKTTGSRAIFNKNDSIVRIPDLNAFVNYTIEFEDRELDNIAWRFKKRIYSVLVDPNQFKRIDVPVIVVGEVSGMVFTDRNSTLKGIGRIRIKFYERSSNRLVAETLSEYDGYIYYMGLRPGEYVARIDSAQLSKLNFIVDLQEKNFTIKSSEEGDIVDGLDFTLEMNPSDTTVITPIAPITQVMPEKPLIRKDTSYMTFHVVIQELVTITEDSYAIQLGAFKRRSNAEVLRNKLKKLLVKDVEIVTEGDLFKVRITGLKDSAEVDKYLLALRLNGISEVWMIHQKAKKQQWVSTEKQDSIARIKETIIEKPIPILSRNLSIQAGAFNTESYALALRDRLKGTTDKTIEMVAENGYFKVRITGFTSRIEMEKLLPSLGVIGLNDIWILPAKEDQVPVIRQPVAEQPVIAQPDTTDKKIEEKTEVPIVSEKPVKPEPLISLQVGIFYKKSEALRAQRRIRSKLILPVEIVEQWNYYQVIVPGFYTREETYKYYPELAGLGYPGISLIEKK